MHPAQWVTRFKAISRLIQLGSELTGEKRSSLFVLTREKTPASFLRGVCSERAGLGGQGQPAILYFSNAPQGMPAGWALRLLSREAMCQ